MFAILLVSTALSNPCEHGPCLAKAPDGESVVEPSNARPDPRGLAMKRTGIALTAHGTLVALTGGALALTPVIDPPRCSDEAPDCGMGSAFAVFYGTSIALTSVPLLATGIPLWAVGQKRINDRRRVPAAVDVRVTPTLHRPGLVVTGRW